MELINQYKNGLKEGYWRQGDDFPICEGYYKNGNRVGEWIGYYDNGKLRYKGRYSDNGKSDGYWEHYNKAGVAFRKRFYVK